MKFSLKKQLPSIPQSPLGNAIIAFIRNNHDKHWFRWTKRISLTLVASILLFLILNSIFPLHTKVEYAQLITAKDGSVLYAFLSHDDKWRMKTELNEITPELRKAIIHKEDRLFYYHPGVNVMAIGRAVVNNIFTGRKTSGASTITMQVARLLEPKQRTYGNKIIEIFRALQLEWYYSKDEILQLYLNLVPYGGNVEGVKSAALLYFGQLPNRLSVAQITTLAIVPNRPTSLSLNRNPVLLKQERDKWLKRFQEDEIFSDTLIDDAINEPLQLRRTPLPNIAPHLSYRLHTKYPEQAILKTTLNRITQDKVQQLAYNYHKRIRKYNIHNLAVIVADNKKREIIAYIGSPDFTDNDHAGQVDNARAIRSPGSTLKPLVYALGIEAGKITPKTMLLDVPSQFGGYSPENFDQKFNGAVTVENALVNSLNIPAVKVLEDITVPVFVNKLKAARFEQISRDERKLGLSVILGGCGTTLEELVGLYSSFANEGLFTPISSFQSSDGEKKTTVRLISRQAAYMINEILMQAVRPDLPTGYQNSYHAPPIAWKTGTSYGRKDAWSIGYNRKYTVGVWVGNANAEGVPELTGADIATPLLFQLFNTIDYNAAGSRLLAPKNMPLRLVCTETGLLPGDYCTHQVVDYYIPLISNTQTCKHMKEVPVSADESFSYCTACLPESGYKKKLYENLPPALVSFYNTWSVAYRRIPPHNPSCTRVFQSGAPQIVTPADGREYMVDATEPPEMLLTCHVDNDVKQVYWYINDKFYKAAKATDRVFFKPDLGEVKISCSDDKGRNTNISIVVKKM
ncbi:penicillin-binding protein 1C [Cytophagaceae bacterium DM2B3-1]|uniref:peptidoglycan glycosyltransferase n=1 Tax=Xanthocytophaga flava TaxID=3048013 RepID=A0ABT7CJU2_9BACT|nr:penicillin-binding protein 1C [Xanthocytophaga flavus]MDJ1493297.1 penicillin-binding protein 1C [Xanthocytophaga flavus]